MSVEDILLDNGFDGVKYLVDYSYDDALVGVTTDNRAVYSYQKMVEWLIVNEEFAYEEACEWIDYNVLRALPYMGDDAPIVMYDLERDYCMTASDNNGAYIVGSEKENIENMPKANADRIKHAVINTKKYIKEG